MYIYIAMQKKSITMKGRFFLLFLFIVTYQKKKDAITFAQRKFQESKNNGLNKPRERLEKDESVNYICQDNEEALSDQNILLVRTKVLRSNER